MSTGFPIPNDIERIGDFTSFLLVNSPNPILVINSDNCVKYINPAYLKLTGFSAKDIIGSKPPFPHWPTQFHQQYLGNYSDLTIDKDEKQFCRKDGTLFWVEINASHVIEKGQNIWHISHWTDITQRKQVEAELRQSEEKFSKAFQGSPLIQAISLVADGQYLEVNNAFLTKMGYQREEVIGHTAQELGIFQDYNERQIIIKKLLKNETIHDLPVNLRTRQGKVLTFNASVETLEINKQACLLTSLEDITQRIKMEDDLRASEEKYRLLVEHANESIVVIQEGVIKFVNSATRKLTGYSASEMLGQPFIDFVHPEDRELAMRNYHLRLKQDVKIPVYELKILTKNQHTRWACINGTGFTWEGKPATLNLLSDVTERKSSQEKINQRDKLLGLLALNAKDMIFRLRLKPLLKLEYISPSALAFTGYETDTLYQHPEILQELRQDESKDHTVESPANLPNKTREMRWTRKNGSTIWTEESTTPLFDDIGELAGIEGIVRDITERKRAESSLADELARRRIMVDQSNDGILVMFPDGAVYETNQQFAEMIGYTPEEVLKLHIWDWDKQNSRAELISMLEKVDEKGGHYETMHLRKDGSTYNAEISSNSVIFGGQKLILCICRDISGRKLTLETLINLYTAENKLRLELQQEAISRGMFIEVLAHDLRTPLTPILASTSILKEILEKKNDDTLLRLSHNIHKSTLTIITRLEELLDIGRYSRGTFILRKQPTNIADFIRNIRERFEPGLDPFRQKLVIKMPDDLQLEVNLDQMRIEQVLNNLLSNAAKFSAQGDITLKVQDKADRVIFSVTDQGVGITREEQARIFQPYHRVEQDRQKLPGLGLGLNVSKNIVEAHDGEITVISEPGKGSTFTFWLPGKTVKE
jgi:PAS domain S-box-containing protein